MMRSRVGFARAVGANQHAEFAFINVNRHILMTSTAPKDLQTPCSDYSTHVLPHSFSRYSAIIL